MAGFDNIDSSDDILNIISYNPTSIPNVKLNSEILDGNITPVEVSMPADDPIYLLTKKYGALEEEEIVPFLVAGSCDVSRFYGDGYEDGAFKLGNLFSELVDDYQRFIARQNLGISEQMSLVWGNITGNLASQHDLYSFILNSIASSENDLIDELNLKLAQWAYDVRIGLDSKAGINSPHFTGTPTTPTPEITDNSQQIASTGWVNTKIEEAINSNLEFFSLNTSYMYYGDSPVTLVCSWDYTTNISSQYINGLPIDISDRSYIFQNVSSSMSITLTYIIEGVEYNRVLNFQKIYPKYIGKILNHSVLPKSKENNFTFVCNENENLYIYNPGPVRIANDGLVGGFSTVGTLSLWGITYYIYQTVHSGLGQLYITLL